MCLWVHHGRVRLCLCSRRGGGASRASGPEQSSFTPLATNAPCELHLKVVWMAIDRPPRLFHWGAWSCWSCVAIWQPYYCCVACCRFAGSHQQMGTGVGWVRSRRTGLRGLRERQQTVVLCTVVLREGFVMGCFWLIDCCCCCCCCCFSFSFI